MSDNQSEDQIFTIPLRPYVKNVICINDYSMSVIKIDHMYTKTATNNTSSNKLSNINDLNKSITNKGAREKGSVLTNKTTKKRQQISYIF